MNLLSASVAWYDCRLLHFYKGVVVVDFYPSTFMSNWSRVFYWYVLDHQNTTILVVVLLSTFESSTWELGTVMNFFKQNICSLEPCCLSREVRISSSVRFEYTCPILVGYFNKFIARQDKTSMLSRMLA